MNRHWIVVGLVVLVTVTGAAASSSVDSAERRAITEVELGRLLFWDPILSGSRDISCATCHHPDLAYADGRQLSLGTGSVGLGPARMDRSGGAIPVVKRNSPIILNVAFNGNTNIRSNATAVSIVGGAVANSTITAFANNSVSGDTTGAGIIISNVTFDTTPGAPVQQVNGGTLAVGAIGNPVGGGGLSIGTSQGNLTFDDLDVLAAVGTALNVTGTGTGLTFGVAPVAPAGTGSSTIDADLPPSSRKTFFTVAAAVAMTRRPVAVEPVNVTASTRGSAASISPRA